MSIGWDMVIFSFAHASVDNGAGLDGALREANDHPQARRTWTASM